LKPQLSILFPSNLLDVMAFCHFSETNGVNHMGLNNGSDATRTVTLQRSDAGFGFQMRGANCKYCSVLLLWIAAIA